MSEQVDCVVIGAGVVGLSVARRLAIAGRDVLLVEREDKIGTGLSSRNSGVIHGGIYYPKNSLKASLCLQGNSMLYDYCDQRRVDYARCGKLIVATQKKQLESLRRLKAQGLGNGVTGLRWIDGEEALQLEPELQCIAALECPTTGLVDVSGLMLALLADGERAGLTLSLRSEIRKISFEQSQLTLDIASQGELSLRANTVINCAGLSAQRVAATCSALAEDMIPRLYFAKGNYYAYSGKNPFKRLIYPMPNSAGLGIHATMDLGGRLRFGPDVEWVDKVDFCVNGTRREHFFECIQAYWPGVTADALTPDFASIRPKLVGPGVTAGDFQIHMPDHHGIPGLCNLYGIESPGLTSALAIAEYIARRMGA
ncbi:MAG: FAD-dependent oxidoreductase [Gammaproteobacteria bacterium]|nr:MAG: FAD-dependent oxidoreductase [Gammaproteobacteria bacterium]